jgi:hypothetical protein
LRELGGDESDFNYTLPENFVLFDEQSEWLFNFIEDLEESDPMPVLTEEKRLQKIKVSALS